MCRDFRDSTVLTDAKFTLFEAAIHHYHPACRPLLFPLQCSHSRKKHPCHQLWRQGSRPLLYDELTQNRAHSASCACPYKRTLSSRFPSCTFPQIPRYHDNYSFLRFVTDSAFTMPWMGPESPSQSARSASSLCG